MPPDQRQRLLDLGDHGLNFCFHGRLRRGAPTVSGADRQYVSPVLPVAGPGFLPSPPCSTTSMSTVRPRPVPGSVPFLNTSVPTVITPAGTGKLRPGASPSASAKKSRAIGAAVTPPCSRGPRVRGLSKPTHTATTRSGVRPMNQVSSTSLVVPVLPAIG